MSVGVIAIPLPVDPSWPSPEQLEDALRAAELDEEQRDAWWASYNPEMRLAVRIEHVAELDDGTRVTTRPEHEGSELVRTPIAQSAGASDAEIAAAVEDYRDDLADDRLQVALREHGVSATVERLRALRGAVVVQRLPGREAIAPWTPG